MSIDTDALKAGTDIVAVVAAYTKLRKMGVEFCGPCPIHGGDGDNFYVNPAKGIWRCFSRGCDECEEGNDVIGFIRKVENVSFAEACQRLGAKENFKPVANIAQKAKPQPERITFAPPQGTTPPSMKLKGLGEPSKVWEYKNSENWIIGYVARYEVEGGKEIRCWTWGAKGDAEPGWSCGHWSKPRPMYGLDKLAARPSSPVMLVEGEKAADAAQELLGQYVVMSWPGGANAWKHADFSPLRGKRVDLWPDADEPGKDAMRNIVAIIGDPHGLRCYGKLIDPRGMPDGADAADWPGGDVFSWLQERATEYATKEGHEEALRAKEEAPTPPDLPPLPPVEVYAGDGGDDDDDNIPASMSEDMLADRFALTNAYRWRYVKAWSTWFEWRGDGWYRDETGKVDRLAVELTRKALYWPEAQQLTPEGKRKVNSKRTAGAVRDLSMNDRRIAATSDQWDTDPWLLGVPGGVVDLRTGRMRDGDPRDYMTKRTSCAPEAGKPKLWLEFLHRITEGDNELISYLQRYVGYSVTGVTSEHAFAFLYGTGANGKSTFINVISSIFADYATNVPFEVLAESRNERHSTEIARLHGKRFAWAEETDAGGRWNEGRIKRLTGGGKVTARFMRQDDFEFEPQFKLLIAGNHKPMIKAVDEAIKRRIHLVPFTVTIPAEERDKHLLEKLQAEWPQILRWCIDGCLGWQETSLKPPQRVLDATDKYVEAEDILGAWLDDCCDRDPELVADGRILYENYKRWCDAQGESSWARRGWSNAMIDRGYDQVRTKDFRGFRGVKPKLGPAPADTGYDV